MGGGKLWKRLELRYLTLKLDHEIDLEWLSQRLIDYIETIKKQDPVGNKCTWKDIAEELLNAELNQ